MVPLSNSERSALLRILEGAQRRPSFLVARQRAALDAYSSVLSTPPLLQEDVVIAARAMIRVWTDVGRARVASETGRSYGRRIPAGDLTRHAIEAVLLELEDEASSAVTVVSAG